GAGRAGEVPALLLPSTPLYLVAYLATARLGAVTTGINARYRRTEIGHILARARPRLLLAVERWHDADFRAMVDPLPGRPEVVWLGADELRNDTREVVQRIAGSAAPAAAGAGSPPAPAAIVLTHRATARATGARHARRRLL